MTAQDVIRDAGLILAAGLIAAPVAALLRVPIMIILLGFGIALGPTGVGLIENPVDGLGAQLVFTFGVAQAAPPARLVSPSPPPRGGMAVRSATSPSPASQHDSVRGEEARPASLERHLLAAARIQCLHEGGPSAPDAGTKRVHQLGHERAYASTARAVESPISS